MSDIVKSIEELKELLEYLEDDVKNIRSKLLDLEKEYTLPKYGVYIVKPGDTITDILAKYNIPIDRVPQVVGANYDKLVAAWRWSFKNRQFTPKNLADHILPGMELFIPLN